MKGMTFALFMDKIYDGCELEFIIAGDPNTYFVQGHFDNGKYILSVDCWQEIDEKVYSDGYICYKGFDTPFDRFEYFKNTPIIQGKSIYELEKDITVLYNG